MNNLNWDEMLAKVQQEEINSGDNNTLADDDYDYNFYQGRFDTKMSLTTRPLAKCNICRMSIYEEFASDHYDKHHIIKFKNIINSPEMKHQNLPKLEENHIKENNIQLIEKRDNEQTIKTQHVKLDEIDVDKFFNDDWLYNKTKTPVESIQESNEKVIPLDPCSIRDCVNQNDGIENDNENVVQETDDEENNQNLNNHSISETFCSSAKPEHRETLKKLNRINRYIFRYEYQMSKDENINSRYTDCECFNNGEMADYNYVKLRRIHLENKTESKFDRIWSRSSSNRLPADNIEAAQLYAHIGINTDYTYDSIGRFGESPSKLQISINDPDSQMNKIINSYLEGESIENINLNVASQDVDSVIPVSTYSTSEQQNIPSSDDIHSKRYKSVIEPNVPCRELVPFNKNELISSGINSDTNMARSSRNSSSRHTKSALSQTISPKVSYNNVQIEEICNNVLPSNQLYGSSQVVIRDACQNNQHDVGVYNQNVNEINSNIPNQISQYEVDNSINDQNYVLSTNDSSNSQTRIMMKGGNGDRTTLQEDSNSIHSQNATNNSSKNKTPRQQILNHQSQYEITNPMNIQNVHNNALQPVQNVFPVQNIQNMHHVQNIQNVHPVQNIQNVHPIQNIQNMHPIQNIQNTQVIQNLQNAQAIQNQSYLSYHNRGNYVNAQPSSNQNIGQMQLSLQNPSVINMQTINNQGLINIHNVPQNQNFINIMNSSSNQCYGANLRGMLTPQTNPNNIRNQTSIQVYQNHPNVVQTPTQFMNPQAYQNYACSSVISNQQNMQLNQRPRNMTTSHNFMPRQNVINTQNMVHMQNNMTPQNFQSYQNIIPQQNQQLYYINDARPNNMLRSQQPSTNNQNRLVLMDNNSQPINNPNLLVINNELFKLGPNGVFFRMSPSKFGFPSGQQNQTRF